MLAKQQKRFVKLAASLLKQAHSTRAQITAQRQALVVCIVSTFAAVLLLIKLLGAVAGCCTEY